MCLPKGEVYTTLGISLHSFRVTLARHTLGQMGALSALHSCYGPSPSQTLPCDLALCLEIIVLGEVCFFKLRSVFVEGRPIFFLFLRKDLIFSLKSRRGTKMMQNFRKMRWKLYSAKVVSDNICSCSKLNILTLRILSILRKKRPISKLPQMPKYFLPAPEPASIRTLSSLTTPFVSLTLYTHLVPFPSFSSDFSHVSLPLSLRPYDPPSFCTISSSGSSQTRVLLMSLRLHPFIRI